MKLFECFRYESALLLNKIYDVPVFPVFLAEMKAEDQFVRFELNHEFPDVVHKRNYSTQIFVDSLRSVNKEQNMNGDRSKTKTKTKKKQKKKKSVIFVKSHQSKKLKRQRNYQFTALFYSEKLPKKERYFLNSIKQTVTEVSLVLLLFFLLVVTIFVFVLSLF